MQKQIHLEKQLTSVGNNRLALMIKNPIKIGVYACITNSFKRRRFFNNLDLFY